LGYTGQHLQLTVPDLTVTGSGQERHFADCQQDALHTWSGPNSETFFGYNGEVGRTEDFWILDVDGTRLVLVVSTSPAAPPEDLIEMEALFDSIRIEP
jgi:hypothetical protein